MARALRRCDQLDVGTRIFRKTGLNAIRLIIKDHLGDLFDFSVAANGSNSDTAKALRIAFTMPRSFDYTLSNYLADKL
jgi:hypothetical protein